MVIKVINKLNKEYGSMTTVKLGDQEFPLTEKELIKLVNALYEKREDVFDSLDFIKDLKYEIESLKERD